MILPEDKYELTDETIEQDGHTLNRIKALKDFGDVKKGDLGGFIEQEYNLVQVGNCWVGDNAKVFGSARVDDNAQVTGNAYVFGNARVKGDARIYGKAHVYGNADVYENAKVYGNALVFEDARVYGDAQICGRAKIKGNAKISEGKMWKGEIVEGGISSVKINGREKKNIELD